MAGLIPIPVLVYLPTGEVISSNSSLQRSLTDSGWESTDKGMGGDPDRLLYIKRPSDSSVEFISLPKDVLDLTSVDMYDIVSKNPTSFAVRFN